MKVNERYAAFVAAHGPGRGNWEYLAFISRMKRDYAAVRGLPGVEVGGPHIEDHADFTAFIVEWAPWDSLPP